MRVATRRLRAALEMFAPCFPRRALKAALRDVKKLADALGERRDRDVSLAALDEIRTAMGPAQQPGIAGLIDVMREEQGRANRALAPHVSGERLELLRARLAELTARAERGAPATERPALRAVA
jgi:CHAD domain-containing protein